MRSAADVVIIGGGCMGTSTAYHLSRLGITNVVLIERERQLATGSTGRNAGGVRHQFSTPENIAFSIESIRLMERFEDEVGYPMDFHQDGYLFLLSTPESVSTFKENIALQRRLGVEVDLLTPADAARLAPGLNVDGVIAASYCARDGIADPNGLTTGFARAAQAAGVEIERDTEATGITVEANRITAVATTRGTIATPIVVNAAGPHAASVAKLAGVELPVEPLRRHIFIAQPPRSAVAGVDFPATHIMAIDFATSFYFHREGANIFFGMGDPDEVPGFDMTVQWDFLDSVVEVALTRLPVLAEGTISHAWAGLYAMSPDANAIIGPAGQVDGLYLINGFSGHGFQHAPAVGRHLATLIAGHRSDVDLGSFALDRVSTGETHPEANVV
jgi:sarcosine oxidase subunit beta